MVATVRMLGLVVIVAAVVSARALAAEASDDIYSVLAAEWGSQVHTCESNPHVISFSADRSRAVFTYRFPPEESHKWSGIAIERKSPEHSTENTISFHVLDHGATWIALRRDGETALDRLGQPLTWKLRLTKDKKGYRWQLYGGVARKKSILRGVLCETAG